MYRKPLRQACVIANIRETLTLKAMPQITVKRAEDWLHKYNNVQIIIDDVEFASLKNGQRKVLHLPPGEHKIEARMNWFGSRKQEFILSDCAYTSFYVKRFRYAKVTGITTVCIGPLILLWMIPVTGLFPAMGGAILLYLTFILLFGRHKYLEIENVSPKS